MGNDLNKENGNAIAQLECIVAQLRHPETGCPWDIKQDFDSIIPCTLEEVYEVVDAIQSRDWDNLKEELGDLLMQVVFYAQLAKEEDLFQLDDVIQGLNDKLIRRHPHVFQQQTANTAEEALGFWEQEKAKEKDKQSREQQSILDSVPRSLPALSRAYKVQKKCAKHGFDWNELPPVIDKIHEELEEVRVEINAETLDQERIADELGDLLFANVNLVRHLGHDPEVVLRKACQKFERRFKGVEQAIVEKGKTLKECTLSEMDVEWDRIKKAEK